jgi:SSS family solute:Na+ symporter
VDRHNVYFQYFSVLITIVSAIVMLVVSYLTQAPDYRSIRSLTYETASDDDRRRTRAGWGARDVAASAVVLVAILGAYLYFRG